MVGAETRNVQEAHPRSLRHQAGNSTSWLSRAMSYCIQRTLRAPHGFSLSTEYDPGQVDMLSRTVPSRRLRYLYVEWTVTASTWLAGHDSSAGRLTTRDTRSSLPLRSDVGQPVAGLSTRHMCQGPVTLISGSDLGQRSHLQLRTLSRASTRLWPRCRSLNQLADHDRPMST
jgi:hypothetical protein